MRALSSSTPAAFRPNIPTESDKKPSSSSSQAGPSTGAASTSGQVVSQGGEHIVDIEQLTPEHESGHEGQGRDSSTGENQQKKLDKSASLTNGFKVDRVGRTGTGDALFHAVARNLNAVVEPPVTGGHTATAKTLRAKIAFYLHEHKAHLMQDEKFKAMLSKEGKNIDKAFDKLLNFSERTSNQWGIKLKDKKTMPSLLSAALNKDISVYRPSSSATSLKEDFTIKHAELFGTSTEVDDAPPITLLLSKKGKHFDNLHLPALEQGRTSSDNTHVSMIAVSPPEHKFMVANDMSNGLTLAEKKEKGLLSPSGRFELLNMDYDNPVDQKILDMNEEFERELCVKLEHHAAVIAKKMSKAISGFHTLKEAKSFVNDNLASKLEHVDSDVHNRRRENRLTKMGISPSVKNLNGSDYSEKNLFSAMKKAFPKAGFDKPPADYPYGWCDDKKSLSKKKAWLGQFKAEITSLKPTEENRDIRKHFRKVSNTVKTNDMLLNQRGYFGGSLEFAAGIKDDLEYWVYLMSTKTRSPKNQELEFSPKQMIPYSTSSESLMPYGNNFSMSFAHADVGKFKHIPQKELDKIEGVLQDLQTTHGIPNDSVIGRLYQLAKLDGYERANTDPVTLKEVLGGIEGLPDEEDRLKELFTDILKLPWSDRDFGSLEENPFSRMGSTQRSRLSPADVRDPQLMNSKDPVETLRSGTRRGHVVGKKANMLFTARSASWSFRGKLNKLDSKEAMDAAYGKYVGNVAPKSTTLRGKAADLLWASETSKDLNRKKEAVIEHDVAALDSWFLTAKDAHKPIYAGPSGHTLAYLNLYAHAVDELVVQRSNWIKQDKKIDLLESKANTESLAPEDKALINKARQLFQAREVQYNLDKRMSRLEDKAEDKTITKEEQAELKNIIKTLKQNMQDVAVKKTQGVALEDMPADKLSLDQADTLLQKNLDKLIKKLNIGANTLKGIDQQAVAEANDKIKQGGYPSLEEARLVMMASLMGDKEHHSWDEVMIASHGVKTKVFDKESPENNLKYNFRGSYGDMFTSSISSVQKTAQQAMQSVENKFSSRPDFSEAMTQWKDKVSSTDQPGDEAVVTHENLSKRDLAAFKATQQRGVSKSDLGWATPVYAGALGTMLYDAFTVAVSQVPVAMMGKQLAICASEFANSTVTGASSPGASDVMMKEVQERLGTPFVAGAIILAGAAISDAIEYKKSGKLNSVSAAQNMAKFTPQISIKALSTAVGSALTIGLGKWLPGQLVRCNPAAAAATISVREAAQLLVNNPMNAAAYRLSEKVPKMLSQIPGVNLESEVLSYAKGHESKAILLHLLRSTGVLAVTTGLQATGSLSTNQFSIDNLLLNFVMHASTEFLVDAMLEKRGWATKESGKDADSIMKNMSSAALGHPTGKVADALVPKPKGYAPETRLPKLEHADEKAVFALTGGNSSATLAAKIAVSIGTYIGWSAFNAADDKGGAIGMNVLSQTVISVILAAKRLQDAGSGSHSPHELPPVVRWYQDAKQLVNDKLGLDVSSDIASLHEDMEMGKMEILDPATLAAEEAAANSAASSEQYALDMQQALGSAFHQGEASSSGTSHQKATLTEITEEPELKQNR